MKIKNIIRLKPMLLFILMVAGITLKAQTTPDTATKKKYQAKPPQTQKFGADAFKKNENTVIRWTGNGGFFINSRGTTVMIDPLLKGFDMPLLIEMPIQPSDVPRLDAVLITHSDNDHFSIPTLTELAPRTKEFHSTLYVDSLMKNKNFPSFGHNIGDTFFVNNLRIVVTPADHDWQNDLPEKSERHFKKEDFAGFWLETPDGSIWAPGDSRLMDEHLKLKTPDAILFDFSDSEWHFTFEGALKIAAAYPNTPLLLSHWGTVDAPDFTPFNADPEKLLKHVVNPGRVVILAPGEPYILKLLHSNK